MNRKFSRRQILKTAVIGTAVTGAVIVAEKIIRDSSGTVLPNPYPVMPDKKEFIPAVEGKLLFFNVHQYNMVAALAALIVPADDSPGALDAGVPVYIDRLVAGSENIQKRYAKGLDWIDHASNLQFGKDFLNLSVKEQIELLIVIDETETNINRPVSRIIERIDRKIDELWNDVFGVGNSNDFFKIIRTDVFYGYYSNPISWPVAGYYGPPQPVGYLDYAEPPSSEKYISTIRQIKNTNCQNCHFEQIEKKDHKDQHDCLDCHEIHFPFQ